MWYPGSGNGTWLYWFLIFAIFLTFGQFSFFRPLGFSYLITLTGMSGFGWDLIIYRVHSEWSANYGLLCNLTFWTRTLSPSWRVECHTLRSKVALCLASPLCAFNKALGLVSRSFNGLAMVAYPFTNWRQYTVCPRDILTSLVDFGMGQFLTVAVLDGSTWMHLA